MGADDVRSDWLTEKLREIAARLLQADVSEEDLAWCADQLQRIVADLRSPEEAFRRPRRRRSPWRRWLTAAIIAALLGHWTRDRGDD
jgi:hypothetical protein